MTGSPARTLATVLAPLVRAAGLSASDRAVRAAPTCRNPPAAPRPVETPPGTVYAWRPDADPARPVPGWDDVVSVAGTGQATAGVHADGTVSVYGRARQGSFGDGDPRPHTADTPQRVPGITDARLVHAVGQAFFVVRADRTVLGWGDGFLVRGGVRRGGRAEPDPVPVRGLTDVVALAGGLLTAFALRGDGRVAGWGINLTAVLGDRHRTSVTTIRGVRGVVDVAAAGAAVVAVVAASGSGTVCAWGNNVHGQLGVRPTGGQTGRPVTVPGLADVVQVAGGRDVALALDGRGAVWAWGRGVHGVLGDGDVTDHVSAVPSVVPGLPPVRRIGAGGLTGYAVDTDGGLWGWGSGPAMGGLSGGAVPVPVPIPLPGPVLAVSGTHAIVG